MTKLERFERTILIFLVAALILGLVVSTLRKLHPPARVAIEKFNTEAYKTVVDDVGLVDQKVDINSASAEELMRIKGIVETIAERIVKYRYNNGNFALIDECTIAKIQLFYTLS